MFQNNIKISYRNLIVFLPILVLNINTYCQFNYIHNGSLNGIIGQSNFPTGWTACDSYSSPDIYAVFFPTGVGSRYAILPVTDSTFMLLKVRGKHHTNLPGPYTYEYITQKLVNPLEPNSTFRFSAYHCFNSHMEVQDLYDPHTVYPARLELWAGNDSCAHEKLLMQTEALQDTLWTLRQCSFTTGDVSYSYIRVAASWDSMNMNIHHESYNGMLLLDDLKINKLPGLDTIKSYSVAYQGDGKTILSASEGASYSWQPEINLSAYNVQSPIMQCYSENYTVAIGSLTTCSFMEKFNISFSCDTLYPDKISKKTDVVYYRNKTITLNASAGTKFEWQPREKVSDDTIRSPFLTSYDSVFMVTIWDKYNCQFNEKFNIIINCDSLNPQKHIVSLDTLVKEGSIVKLVPGYGNVENQWNPSKWLSCTDCREPFAEPLNSITYQVTLKDEFGCTHSEAFNIKIDLFVPNVITPNNDGYNDCFKIAGLPDRTSIKIYNKAGLLIFYANPYNDSNCWKGSDSKGNALSADTYWYVLDNPEQGLTKKGFVFLKR